MGAIEIDHWVLDACRGWDIDYGYTEWRLCGQTTGYILWIMGTLCGDCADRPPGTYGGLWVHYVGAVRTDHWVHVGCDWYYERVRHVETARTDHWVHLNLMV